MPEAVNMQAIAQMIEVAQRGLEDRQEVAILVKGWSAYITITAIEPIGSNPLLLELLLPRGEAVYCPLASVLSVWTRPAFAERGHVAGPGSNQIM